MNSLLLDSEDIISLENEKGFCRKIYAYILKCT